MNWLLWVALFFLAVWVSLRVALFFLERRRDYWQNQVELLRYSFPKE